MEMLINKRDSNPKSDYRVSVLAKKINEKVTRNSELLETKEAIAQIHKRRKVLNMNFSSKKTGKDNITASDGLLDDLLDSSPGQIEDLVHTQFSYDKEEKALDCDPQVSANANETQDQYHANFATQSSEPTAGPVKFDDLLHLDSHFEPSTKVFFIFCDAELKSVDDDFEQLLQSLVPDPRAVKDTSAETPVPAAAAIDAAMLVPPSVEAAALSEAGKPQTSLVVNDTAPALSTSGRRTDAWSERLDPRLKALIYWRDVKQSAIVFGTGIITLLAIALLPVVSVLASLSLLLLGGTIAFRIYESVMYTNKQTSDGLPFKSTFEEYLELMTLSEEKMHHIAGIAVDRLNDFTAELRSLFLAKDLVRSIDFGILLWVLTYIGAWFNGTTLLILSFVSLFTLPKVLEINKEFIESYSDLARGKLAEIKDAIKLAIPNSVKRIVDEISRSK